MIEFDSIGIPFFLRRSNGKHFERRSSLRGRISISLGYVRSFHATFRVIVS